MDSIYHSMVLRPGLGPPSPGPISSQVATLPLFPSVSWEPLRCTGRLGLMSAEKIKSHRYRKKAPLLFRRQRLRGMPCQALWWGQAVRSAIKLSAHGIRKPGKIGLQDYGCDKGTYALGLELGGT